MNKESFVMQQATHNQRSLLLGSSERKMPGYQRNLAWNLKYAVIVVGPTIFIELNF